ncbi:MAG: chemotaxis protein CheB, partial [Alphaproteobacteria bacterium]
STLTRENAVVTMQALKDGAADYLTKPTSAITAAESFRRDLLGKIIGLGQAHRDRRRQGTTLPAAATDARAPTNAPAATRPPGSTIPAATPATRPTTAPRASAGTHVPLRHSKAIRAPAALAIGSSTGGPQALIAVFEALEVSRQQPIFITQHMPPTFTAILAEQLTNHGKWACHEGADGMAVEPGHAYIAPGDYHMTVQDKDGHKVIRLNQDAAENYCRPSVDVMLRSITKAYAGSVVAVILTGMGQDGLAGGRHLVDAGGHVVAQDEASSVVWGMPGAVATAGICDAILPLADVAGYINRLVAGAPS